jgi:hypothetical protein
VEEAARSVLQDPLRITVGERNAAASTVAQRMLFVGREEGKLLAIRQLLGEGVKPPVLVFVASKVWAVVVDCRSARSALPGVQYHTSPTVPPPDVHRQQCHGIEHINISQICSTGHKL